ncbi:MAG TPA: PAS domain S-box protein [Saprospiraceae bacterium]|nr:PAS domain S-box protein [Saprospiraceae bacterium]
MPEHLKPPFNISKSAVITSLFVVALVTLMSFAFVAYLQLNSLNQSEISLQKSRFLQLKLEKLYSDLKDMRSGIGGFIITRDSVFLSGISTDDSRLFQSLDSIDVLIADKPEQEKSFSDIRELIQKRISTLEKIIELSALHPIPLSEMRLLLLESKTTLEVIRAKINAMIFEETQYYAAQRSRFATYFQLVPLTYLLVILFAISIFTFAFFKIRSDLSSETLSRFQLESAIQRLNIQNSIISHGEESANTGSFIWKLSSDELICSENLIRMLGLQQSLDLKPHELLLLHIYEEDQPKWEKKLKEVEVAKEINHEIFRMLGSTGEIKYFRVNIKRSQENFSSVLLGSFQDITSDILLNEKLNTFNTRLRRSELLQSQMISEVEDYAIFFLDPEGIIVNWNKGAEKIKGYTEEEVVGKSFSIFFTEEDQKRALPAQLLRLAKENGRISHEGWRIRKDKSKYWGSIAMTAVHDDSGKVMGYTKVTRDLTLQKQSEEDQLRYQQHIEQKNIALAKINNELASFNYVASHDLQEPLRKIQTFISRIEDEDIGELSPKAKDYFDRINTATVKMQQLIHDLISYSQTNNPEANFEKTDLNFLLPAVIAEMKQKLEETKGLVEVGPLPTIQGIPFQLEQLFTNLIDNSLKYHREGTAPLITISSTQVNNYTEDSSTVAGPFYKITFSDNGIGFENQYAESIFTVFQRLHSKTEYSGTGIGLAICKKIVENHHGFIQAHGELNHGATFQIYFPV